MHVKTILGMIAFTTVALIGLIASAAPIAFNEATSGDLSSDDPLSTFTFDTGVNTVSGTTGLEQFSTEYDSFAFVVPAGLKVTSASVVITPEDPNPFVAHLTSASWRLYSGSTMAFGGNDMGLISPDVPGNADLPGLPLSAGSYNLNGVGFSFMGRPAFANYVFSFTVDSVPEPGSLAIALPVAGGLLRRRRTTER